MIRDLLLLNDTIRSAKETVFTPGQVGLLSGWGVFSTIKITGGILFAFERHWARMRRDADLLRIPFPWNVDEMRRKLGRLIEANGEQEATLRVVVLRNRGTVWEGPGIANDFDLVAFTASRQQWGESAKLGVVAQARHAENVFAGAKMSSWAMNLVWYEEAHLRGQDEVVLLNERGEVSECTSANIFAVFGDTAVTPPLSSGCLPGITRELLLETVRAPGVRMAERVLRLDDLSLADGVFITSTTRDLLEVREIEGLAIRRESRVRSALSAAFALWQSEYVTRASNDRNQGSLR